MNRTTTRSIFICFLLMAATGLSTFAQNSIGQNIQDYRPITTAVPILLIAPDARAAAMGDVGVATSPDANSTYWNPAKLGFIESDFEASLSYTPWLKKVVSDMYLAYLSGHKRLTPNSSIAVSLMYFDLGEIIFSQTGTDQQPFNPKEYAVNVSYGQKLSENLSLGVGARYIRSNLAGNTNVVNPSGNYESQPGNSAAVDLGIYYTRDLNIGSKNVNLALGGNISNMGAKISYSTAGRKDFLPTNLRLGTALTMELDPYNKITLAIDGNKLLVPYSAPDDASSNDQTNVFAGIFKSFNDAPGGASEEFKEITLSSGLEYWYDNTFAARAGYFYENELKGGRKYLTMGLGLRYQQFGVDAAYLIPSDQNNPLAQTLRFSLHFKFDGQ
ncbi:type IX secretion system outer membrane channel protein PorV [Nibribacter ruber]|uniref:Type IX secretion system outer membrane channel protein PorV n=1 Tax=Nibribacter ruber TaxID=2698458 RepID=A0A6P1P082_9BACT|nr:type IX secretion system outer membrane channel protein PorV [Nibribacter ruber]QHL87708.1 type IX secretion system outer membrane channel protein PorV [Nibribacter ruber]